MRRGWWATYSDVTLEGVEELLLVAAQGNLHANRLEIVILLVDVHVSLVRWASQVLRPGSPCLYVGLLV